MLTTRTHTRLYGSCSLERFVGKAKGMAREFSRAMNDAADEAGVSDIQKTIKTATNPVGTAMDGVKKATQDMTKSLDPTKFEPESETGKLATERAEQVKKIQATAARNHAERMAREAEEALAKADEAEAALNPVAPDAETKS